MSDFLQVAGGIAACASAAAVLLVRDPRLRAAAMAAGLALAVALVAGQAWHGQLDSIRHDEAKLALLILAGGAGIVLLAALFGRRPELLPLGLIAALPFRIPVDAGGESSNLLLPLYAVIAGGAALALRRVVRGGAPERQPAPSAAATWLARALAASLVLYALQAAYSSDIDRATQNIAFFFVPFALAFAMLRDADWRARDSRLLRMALGVVVAEGVVFALIGLEQEIARHIFWNDKAMESNEFDVEFRVNSLFWDPNIYGRYLALTVVLATSALAWVRDRRLFAAGAAAAAVIFAGLYFSYSQTSMFALIAGLVVLGALRWSFKWTAAFCAAAAVLTVVAVIAFRGDAPPDPGNAPAFDASSGRSELTSGGLDLAKDRPLQGFGSGAFAVEFEKRNEVEEGQAAVSHTEPVTIAAEQGIVGILVYAGLLLAAAWLLLWPLPRGPARVALAAAAVGLFIHTLGYAGFLTDPLTWSLLAITAKLRE